MAADESRPEDISDNLFEEAARWFARLREADVAPGTRRKFQRWLEADTRHAAAYEQAQRLWSALDMPAKQAAARNEAAIEALIAAAGRSRSRGRTMTVGLLLLAGMAAAYWWHAGGLDDLRATYVTAPGGYRQEVLDDGTLIDLNTDTSLAIAIKPDHRTVTMFRGEALFKVAHDATRPFTVITPDGEVEDIGTVFDVRIGTGATMVSLVEGAATVAPATRSSRSASLRAGEQVEVSTRSVGSPRPFQVTTATAWKSGQLVFFRTPLGEVVDELNRYQRGRIVILRSQLRSLPVTGVFSTRRPAEAIDIIEATLGVASTRMTNALIILR